MGSVIIPQVITPSKASGAQIIDGSLKFDENSKNYLTRTPSSAGNRKLWTWSSWLKFSDDGNQHIFSCNTSEPRNYIELYSKKILVGGANYDASNSYFGVQTPNLLRDIGWYHVVVVMDTDQSAAADRVKIYLNGALHVEEASDGYIGQGDQPQWNNTGIHYLGWNGTGTTWFNGQMSQCYLIDGQALTPESFGFTDPLTNTWKPKKYTGTFGTNGFWLPMDGNSPIGQDKSGNGNDWTPQGFGGSIELDNPNVSGARPTLNTTQGGTQAGVGVFGSSENKVITVTVASKTGGGNAYFFDGVERDSLALIRGTTIRFDTTDSSNDSHPFKLSSTNADSSGGTEYTDGVAYFVNGGQKNGTDYVSQYSSHSSGFRGIKWTVPHNVSTTYYYCTVHSGMGEDGRLTSTTDETKADKFAWKCFFALPCVGPNIDLSSVINLKSGGKALTVSGASASSTETHFYNKSIYFDGSNDNIKTESTSHFLSPAEYTIEGWINITSSPGNNQGEAIFDTGSGGSDPELNVMNNSGTLQLYESLSNNTNWDGSALQTGRWYHFAQVVQGSSASDSSAVHKIYIDGQLSLTNTINLSGRSASSIACIGSRTNDTVYGNFYLSDLRFYQIAKYTSNFVVPSTSPDILPDTPSGVSGASKLTKITDGAVHFDGNGDYLEATSSTDFAFGTGDFTLEAYIYATSLPNTNNRIFCSGAGGSGDRTNFQLMVGSAGYLEFAHSTNYQTSNGLIGTNKWHHVAATREGTSLRMFIDGRLHHTGTSSVNVTENGGVTIGREFGYSSYFNGYISNARILKGTALYTDDFTVPARTLTNVTNTKLLCCQSPTSATTATVASGTITANGNAAADNFNPFNTDINTVRGQETGYPTWNPLKKGSSLSLSNGNLTATKSGGGYHSALTTITTPTTGKWFYEVESNVSGNNLVIGIAKDNFLPSNLDNYVDIDPNGYIYRASDGAKSNNNSASSYGDSYSSGDVVGVGLDLDAGTLTFYKNGISQGVAFSSLSGRYYFGLSIASGYEATANFGQKPFKFPPPDGFQPLNAANIRPVKVISRPDQYVGVTTGNFDQQKTHVTGFQPDLIWHKARTSGSHFLTDSVRGVDSYLVTNSTNAAGTFPVGGQYGITSFNSNGWTQGSYGPMSEGSMVAWSWKAGGNKNTFNVDDVGYASAAAAGLTAGTITPVGSSVGTKQGFSIIQYQGNGTAGAQVPHGLTQTPDFTIIKAIDDVTDDSWFVGGNWAPGYGRLLLNSTANDNGSPGNTVAIDLWNNTAPTSSVITIGAYNGVNDTGDDYIMYNWHDVPGLQKFGQYEGNNSTDGPYIELGFRPAIIIFKNIDSSTPNWEIYDFTERDKTNPYGKVLSPNTSGAESDVSGSYPADALSNGIKIRHNGAAVNASNTFFYAAWAEAPTVDLYGGGANAR